VPSAETVPFVPELTLVTVLPPEGVQPAVSVSNPVLKRETGAACDMPRVRHRPARQAILRSGLVEAVGKKRRFTALAADDS
jgi:hypothetical protein